MNQHYSIELVAGDDWEIRALLLDENGDPYDLLLGPPEIKWTLLDRTWKPVFEADDIAISILDAAAGQCAIMVPATATTKLDAGPYTDVIRIVVGGVTSTLAIGPIFVTADPWRVVQTVPAVQSGPRSSAPAVHMLKPRNRPSAA